MLKKVIGIILLVTIISIVCMPNVQVNANLSSPTQYDTLLVSSDGTNRPYFPSITKLQNGDLVAVYFWNSTHVGTSKGVIKLVKSNDNGESWGSPVTIVDWRALDLDVRDPHVNVLSNGDLVLTFFSYRYGDAIPCKGSYFSKSVDGGVTWSTPVLVPSSNYYNASCSQVIELDNGNLLMSTYGPAIQGGFSRVTVIRSNDYGDSWGSETVVASSDSENFNESALVYTDNDTVYCIMRENGKIYKSTDNGYSWSLDMATGITMNAPDFFKIDNDMIFTTWSRPGAYNGNRVVEGKLFCPCSGWNSTTMKLIYNTTGTNIGDMGYSGSILTDDNRILTVYYDTYRGILAGTYSSISDWANKEPEGQKINLLSLYNQGSISVSTDMTWTNVNAPDAKISGAIDGSAEYSHSACKGNTVLPSYYTINLNKTYRIKTLGICLKPGYSESADIYFSTDGVNWDSPV